MKWLTNMMGMALICAAVACNDSSKTSESIESKPDTAKTVVDETPKIQDSAAMMKAWMDYMTPGAMHTVLAKDNGTWNAEVTMWMAPDAPPQKSNGTAVYKMIMGGRYQQGDFTSTFNGMPFEGRSMIAYDNAKKVFVVSWIDNFGTGVMNMEGTYDSTTHQMNFSGKSFDPSTGKECDIRQTFKKIDDNTAHEEMFTTYHGGKEYKNLEITYKRKK